MSKEDGFEDVVLPPVNLKYWKPVHSPLPEPGREYPTLNDVEPYRAVTFLDTGLVLSTCWRLGKLGNSAFGDDVEEVCELKEDGNVYCRHTTTSERYWIAEVLPIRMELTEFVLPVAGTQEV